MFPEINNKRILKHFCLSELIALHISSEFVLQSDLNWDMLNPPSPVQLKLDALIVQVPTRFNNWSMENGTLIYVILTTGLIGIHREFFASATTIVLLVSASALH